MEQTDCLSTHTVSTGVHSVQAIVFIYVFLSQVLTRDSVTVAVDAVVYYRTNDATASVNNVENAPRSTQLLAATTLRNVLGTKNLAEILSERESISHFMQVGSFRFE